MDNLHNNTLDNLHNNTLNNLHNNTSDSLHEDTLYDLHSNTLNNLRSLLHHLHNLHTDVLQTQPQRPVPLHAHPRLWRTTTLTKILAIALQYLQSHSGNGHHRLVGLVTTRTANDKYESKDL